MSRGKPVIEAMLDRGLPVLLGAAVARARTCCATSWVLAVAGTHGKTTTTSDARVDPRVRGPRSGLPDRRRARATSASRRGSAARSIFVDRGRRVRHGVLRQALEVRPLPAAHRSCSTTSSTTTPTSIPTSPRSRRSSISCVRTVPGNGLHRRRTAATRTLAACVARGVWTPVERFGARGDSGTGTAAYESIGERSSFGVKRRGDRLGSVRWRLLGDHNLENALAAIAAARHVGVPADVALARARRVQRREAPAGEARRVRRHRASTRTSRTTRPRSRPRSRACASARQRDASSR